MRRCIINNIIAALCIIVVASCIANDVPYPRLRGNITAFEVSGQTGSAVIDSTKMTVTVDMADSVNLAKVLLLRMEVTQEATFTPELTTYIDLSSPLQYTLTTYPDQSYVWSISATQTIDRYIRAENQVGDAAFDDNLKYAILYVTMDQDLTDVNILDIKLGPSNSTIFPNPKEVKVFTAPQQFKVSYRDIEEIWTINVIHKEVQVVTETADSWAHFAFLKGTYNQSLGTPSFLYKKASDTEWSTVPSGDIVTSGSTFTAQLKSLTAGTEYVYKAVAGETSGSEVRFTTESEYQFPNMNFDDWYQNPSNNAWFPDKDLTDQYYIWDSGNLGANALKPMNPTSPEETFVIKGKSSRMETVQVVGQLAGGNVFSGKFVKTYLTPSAGARVDFGRPFTSRPTKLHGYYSYEPKTIDKAKDPYKSLIGRPDRCHIFLMMFDQDTPFDCNTAEGRYLPPFSDDQVIAYIDLVDSTSTGGKWKEFTAPIIYKKNLNQQGKRPKFCALVAVASLYADYFTGGVGTLLYADEFEFIYDDEVTWE